MVAVRERVAAGAGSLLITLSPTHRKQRERKKKWRQGSKLSKLTSSDTSSREAMPS